MSIIRNKTKESMNQKVNELMVNPILSATRHKSILSIAKKYNISYNQAKQRQAIHIAKKLGNTQPDNLSNNKGFQPYE